MSEERINLPDPVILCKKCRSPQFTLDKKLIHQSKTDLQIFKKLSKPKKARPGKAIKMVPMWMKEGRCKVEGCDGFWFDGVKITACIPKYYGDAVKAQIEARKSAILMPGDPGFNSAVEEVTDAKKLRLVEL